MPIDTILTLLGPIGILLLGGLYIYFRYGQQTTRRFHEDNVERFDQIAQQLTTVNSHMATMEQWRASHDKQDDERHRQRNAECEKTEAELQRHRERLHDVANRLAPLVADFQTRTRRQRMNGEE
jgi:hypothetical protein